MSAFSEEQVVRAALTDDWRAVRHMLRFLSSEEVQMLDRQLKLLVVAIEDQRALAVPSGFVRE